jgi:hypothetical protein
LLVVRSAPARGHPVPVGEAESVELISPAHAGYGKGEIGLDWRVKMLGEKICSFLPYGYRLASAARNRMIDMNLNYVERIDKGLDNVSMIRTLTGFDFENSRVLEVGSGRHGVDCLLFYLMGAGAIYTFDHVLHLEKDIMAGALKPLREKLGDIARTLDVDAGLLEERIGKVKTDGTLWELLRSCNVRYFRYPIRSANLEPGSVDLFYSESVFQRIPAEQLKDVIATVGGLLSGRGVSFHRIDCNDINSQVRHYDAGLWQFEYLKYSDFTWNLMCSKKFNSQNRLREIEFIELLEGAGMNTLYVESLRKQRDVDRLREFKPAKRFRDIPPEELAVGCSKVLSTRAAVPEKTRKIIEEDWTTWYGGRAP